MDTLHHCPSIQSHVRSSHWPFREEHHSSIFDASSEELWSRGIDHMSDDHQPSFDTLLFDDLNVIDPQSLSSTDATTFSESSWCQDALGEPFGVEPKFTSNPYYTLNASLSVACSSSYSTVAPRSVLTDYATCSVHTSPGASLHTFEDDGHELDDNAAWHHLNQIQDVDRQRPKGIRKSSLACIKPQCKRRFNSREDQRRHEKTVHMEPAALKGYRCAYPRCPKEDKIWTRLDNFKSHLVKAHCLDKNSEYLRELVHKSARSSRGYDARFPFIAVDLG